MDCICNSICSLPALKEEVELKVLKILDEIPWVNIALDAWSDAKLRPFIAYTAQGITNDWELKNVPFAFKYLPGADSDLSLAELFLFINC